MALPEKHDAAGSDLTSRVAHRYSGSKKVALNQDFWLNPEDVAEVCPPCGQRMASLGIRRIRASVIYGQDMLKLASTAHQAAEWKDLPEGWTDDSRKKFWESIGGSVARCVAKVQGHVTDPQAFAEALKDRIEGKSGWSQPRASESTLED
jgi:hypothetical protein